MLHLAVNLRRADAHAARVKGGIRTAIDHHATVFGERHPIAMAPDVGVDVKIGGVIAGAVVVVPKTDGHAGEGRGADQFTLAARQGLAVLVEYFHLHAQTGGLDFPAPDG